MDATYQRTIEALLVSNDPVIAINRALGRDPRIDDSEDHIHSGCSERVILRRQPMFDSFIDRMRQLQ